MKKIKILYGIAGEGLGHVMFSKILLKTLTKKYDILIISSNRAFDILEKKFNNVHKVAGLNNYYKDNELKTIRTIKLSLSNVKNERKQTKNTIKKINNFKPGVVISDFEFFSSVYAKLKRLPLICVNNIPIIAHAKIDVPFKEYRPYFNIKTVANMIVPNADCYFLNTFYKLPLKNKKCKYIPFVLRGNIIKAKVKEKNYLLVYQTSTSNTRMIDYLKRMKIPCIIYGFNRNSIEGNVAFKKFDEKGFIKDVAESKAVITNGGLTLINECIFLNKPIFSIPVKKQFEQYLNGVMLEKLGYGMMKEEFSEHALEEFLANYKDYKKNLSKFKWGGNKVLLSELDQKIEEYTKKLL